jgi:hypothetical protein
MGRKKTYATRFKDPEGRAIVVDLIPEPQTDEHSSRDVPYRPEIEGEKDDDEDGLRNAYKERSAREEDNQKGKERTEKT